MLSLSLLLLSLFSDISLLNLEMYLVIFLLTSDLVVPEKLFRFLSPTSFIYQTTPPQRLSVRLNMFPFVSNLFCILSHSLQDKHYHKRQCLSRQLFLSLQINPFNKFISRYNYSSTYSH